MDLGCANGYSTMRLAELNKDITFVEVDINPCMLDTAMVSLRRSNLTNLQFRYIDITREHDVTLKFDFIFAIRVFQNMDNLPSRSENIYIVVAKKAPDFYDRACCPVAGYPFNHRAILCDISPAKS